MKNRIIALDMLRGLAAILVTWFHMTNTYPTGIVKNSGHYAWLGLDIFFVVSGFVIPYSMFKSDFQLRRDWGAFMLKRLARIEPPYIVAVLLCWALLYLSSIVPGFQGKKPDISTEHLLLHFIHLNDILHYSWLNPVFWTLAIELQFYLLILIIYPLLTSKIVSRIICLLIICLVPFLNNKVIFVTHFICVFGYGILAFLFISKIISKEYYFIYLIPITISSLYSVGFTISIVSLLTSLSIVFYQGKINIIFSFLGSISYSLYLIHIPVGGKIVNFGKRFLDSQFEFCLLSIFATCISIFCSYYFFRLVEKPSIILSSRIKY